MSPTTLVTGAFGQVGKRCAEILLGRGHTVVALDLDNESSTAAARVLATAAQPGTLIPEFVDLTDSRAVDALVTRHRPTAIVHLAAIVSPASYRNPRLARTVNVQATGHLVTAAQKLADPPLFVFASSAAVYGSRNPHRQPELITGETPVNPIDQYGEDKVLAEQVIARSGLPYTMFRLAAIVSPDGTATVDRDALMLVRATPTDNRMHATDARDAALAFANAVDRRDAVAGKVLVIAGNDTNLSTMSDMQDDVMAALGIGRLGPPAGLPGDPDDDRGWAFTGWFDTTESQALLDYQQHDWSDTVKWVAESMGHRRLLQSVGPVVRPVILGLLALQRHLERRGRYADPWTFLSGKYGSGMLATSDTL